MKRRSLFLLLLMLGSFVRAEIPKKQKVNEVLTPQIENFSADKTKESKENTQRKGVASVVAPQSKEISSVGKNASNEQKMCVEIPHKQMNVSVGTSQPKEVSFAGKDAFVPQKKRQDVLDLVKRGSVFFENNSFIELVRRINLTSDFNYGELYLFVYDENGNCLAHGARPQMMWMNLKNIRDIFGTAFVHKMIDVARSGGGWVVYEWQGSSKVSYVKMIEKNGKKYVLGCGYYPHSKEDVVVTLVRGASSTFSNYSSRGVPVEVAFSEFSFLGGAFIYGDLSLLVLDKNLVVRANGRDASEVGVSYWDTKDKNGVYFFRAIPETLASLQPGDGHWFEYEQYNASMRTYAEKVVDKQGNPYFILCGYYPRADREAAVELVKRGKEAIKKRGLSTTAGVINDWGNKEFVYGSMGLFIYAFDGLIIADADRPSVAGKNSSKDRDESGYLYVEDMFDLGKKQDHLWLSYRTKRAVCSVYAETIDIEGTKYLIGTGFFPITKESSMVLLVKNALGFLQSEPEEKAFRAFSDYAGKYVVGDLTVFVYGLDGTCYADGLEEKNVWRSMLQDLDEEGRPYVKIMINEGKKGPAKVIFKKNGARMVSYVEPLKKGDKTFIVGSGYFL